MVANNMEISQKIKNWLAVYRKIIAKYEKKRTALLED